MPRLFDLITFRSVTSRNRAMVLLMYPYSCNAGFAMGPVSLVLMARELLRNPYFPFEAVRSLNIEADWPNQYLMAKL